MLLWNCLPTVWEFQVYSSGCSRPIWFERGQNNPWPHSVDSYQQTRHEGTARSLISCIFVSLNKNKAFLCAKSAINMGFYASLRQLKALHLIIAQWEIMGLYILGLPWRETLSFISLSITSLSRFSKASLVGANRVKCPGWPSLSIKPDSVATVWKRNEA